MKYKVFFLSVLFASLAIPNSAKAYDFSYTYQGKTLFYNIVNGEAQVTYQRSLAPTYNNPHLSGTVEIPNVVSYNGNTYIVTSIGNRAFESCSSITSVIIGDSVTSIGTSAFQSCTGLTSVTIGNHVTSIESQAFGYCTGLTSVTIGNSVISIGGSAFNACSSLTSVSLGNSVASIGSYAFSQCTSLDSIVIPNSVTHIGQYAFNQCSGLTYLDLGNGVSYLGFCAFRDCDSLTSITIPSSVDTLYGSVFSSCNNLTTVYYNATNCYEYTNYGSYRSFAYCSSLDTVFVGNSVQTMPSDLFYNTSISTVIIGDSVSTISAGAFDGCRKLTSVFIPNSVTRIEQSAFNGCDSLCSITIPNSVNFIGTAAFVGNSLRTIIIGNGVDTIEQSAFGHSDYYITDTVYIYMMSETVPTFVSHLSPFHFLRCAFVLQGCTAFENYRTYNNYVDGTYTYNFAAQTLLYPADDLILNVSSNNTDRGTAQIVQLYGHDVRCDSTAVISATANSGYHFDHWSTGSTANPDTLHLTSNTSVTAYFEVNAPSQYTITVTSADPTMGTVTGGGTYNANATATLTATANSGYHFTHWQDNNTQNPRTITVTTNATYTAYFEQDATDPCTITTLPYTESFEGSMDCWTIVDANNDNNTWVVSNSFGEGSGVVNPHSGSKMAASFSWNTNPFNANEYLISPAIVLPSSNISLSWWYRVNGEYPADKLAVKVSTTTNATSSFTNTLIDITPTAANNNWTLQTVDLSAFAGQTIYIAFHHHDTYDNNYICIDDITISQGTTPTQYTITVNSANSSMGSVSGGGTYNSGSTATLTAIANSGYRFDHWQDNNTQNPRTITVTGNAAYTAYFVATQGIDDVNTDAVNVYALGGQIVVETELNEEIGIYDVVGRKVDGGRKTFFDVPASGVYLVKVGPMSLQKVAVIK